MSTIDPAILERMRSDWNDRATEDAYYYVAFGRRKQDNSEFFQSAESVVPWLEDQLRYLGPGPFGRALEIGCGPGRLMRPLSAHFAEIHGVDVSDNMIQLAERNLADVPHAHVHATSGTDLALFPDQYFDFAYSYAVFQHIPRREVVLQYLREAHRVLKVDGILTCQINNLPEPGIPDSTWDGVRIPTEILINLARELDCQVLVMKGLHSQYLWATWRKRSAGWRHGSTGIGLPIRKVVCHQNGNLRVPAGRFAEFRLPVKGLSADCDILDLSVLVEGQSASVRAIQPPSPDGVASITIVAPQLSGQGEARLDLSWRGEPLCDPLMLEILPAAEQPPLLFSLTDGVNILSGNRIISRHLKLMLDAVTEPDTLSVRVNGKPVKRSNVVCWDLQKQRYEFTVLLPESVGPGRHRLEVLQGSTALPAAYIDIGLLQSVDVFRDAPAGDRFLEIDKQGICTIVTILGGMEGYRADPIAADLSRLPFSSGTVQAAALHWQSDRNARNALLSELHRILRPDGALYVEVPFHPGCEPEQFVKEIENALGLKYQWRRELARQIMRRTPIEKTNPFGMATRIRGLWSLARRASDKWFKTQFARGGMGFYFGRIWNQPDLRARLNGCVRCGAVYSRDQIFAAAHPTARYGLLLYSCPDCGTPNIVTVDR